MRALENLLDNNLVAFTLYMAPSIVAWYRRRRGKNMMGSLRFIIFFNFFAGFTVVGWFLAMAHAFGYNPVAWFIINVLRLHPNQGGAPGGGPMPVPQGAGGSPQMRSCSSCGGSGSMTCSSCMGRGSWYDPPTGATGSAQLRTCGACISSGRIRCGTCGGSGRVW